MNMMERAHRRHFFGRGNEEGKTNSGEQVWTRGKDFGKVEEEACARSVVYCAGGAIANREEEEGEAGEKGKEGD